MPSESKPSSFIIVRPGVYAERTISTPRGQTGEPALTRTVADHYARLVGLTIKRILFQDYEGQPLPVIEFTNGTTASVMCDPEGNGPGHLDTWHTP